MKKDTEKLPPAFRALADPTRLKILLMLEGKPRTVGKIVDFFDLSQPTISRHLQTLTTAGLAVRQRQGQRVFYAVNAEKVKTLCIELAACFPCCCVTVSALGKGPSKEKSKTRKKATPRGRHRKTSTTKPKGKRA